MSYIVRMPKRGLETDRGTLLEWAVDEGESVAEGDLIAEVGSEQRVTGIEAREDGVLRRTYPSVDESVSSGAPIGIVAPAESDVSDLEAEATADLEANVEVAAEIEAEGGDRPAESESAGTTSSAERGTEADDVTASPLAQERADGIGPNGAAMPGRSVTATNPDGMRGRIEAGSFEWSFDEPESNGGTGTGPTPVDVFLGGLASCLSLSTRYQADKRDASVDEISVDADATPTAGSVERIEATIRLDADEDDETIERIVNLAERGCHVSQLLRDDLPLELSWDRL